MASFLNALNPFSPKNDPAQTSKEQTPEEKKVVEVASKNIPQPGTPIQEQQSQIVDKVVIRLDQNQNNSEMTPPIDNKSSENTNNSGKTHLPAETKTTEKSETPPPLANNNNNETTTTPPGENKNTDNTKDTITPPPSNNNNSDTTKPPENKKPGDSDKSGTTSGNKETENEKKGMTPPPANKEETLKPAMGDSVVKTFSKAGTVFGNCDWSQVAALVSLVAALCIVAFGALCLSGRFPPPFLGGQIGCSIAGVLAVVVVFVNGMAMLARCRAPLERQSTQA